MPSTTRLAFRTGFRIALVGVDEEQRQLLVRGPLVDRLEEPLVVEEPLDARRDDLVAIRLGLAQVVGSKHERRGVDHAQDGISDGD